MQAAAGDARARQMLGQLHLSASLATATRLRPDDAAAQARGGIRWPTVGLCARAHLARAERTWAPLVEHTAGRYTFHDLLPAARMSPKVGVHFMPPSCRRIILSVQCQLSLISISQVGALGSCLMSVATRARRGAQ
jgi:hypothetical protein